MKFVKLTTMESYVNAGLATDVTQKLTVCVKVRIHNLYLFCAVPKNVRIFVENFFKKYFPYKALATESHGSAVNR